ncbi:YesK family protein [Bacillus bombysepticus]|uniref:YesK family protein n=1 Tax=Bacillus bombysepticus TaxID=658666 RepID=UPI00301777BA
MQNFVYIFIATFIVVAVSSALLRKKSPKLYWVPGAVLTVISAIVAFISYFTLNGWDSMSFFFLFLSVLVGSAMGTLVGNLQKSTSH